MTAPSRKRARACSPNLPKTLLTEAQRQLVQRQAFEHHHGDCACPELPCREADFAYGVLCLIGDYNALEAYARKLTPSRAARQRGKR